MRTKRHKSLPVADINTTDDFTLAYIECALWSSSDPVRDESGGEYLDEHYTIADIGPATLKEMCGDCAAFQLEVKDLLAESGLSDVQAGHDFWLSRNGHGAGFVDRGLAKVGKKLHNAAQRHGVYDLIVPNGKAHGYYCGL